MNILIVEDEEHTALMLQEFIEESGEHLVVQKLETVEETVHYLAKHQNKIDLLFFDIQLSDGKSFEIFKHVDVVLPVVFCTAFDQYTLDAIKNNGIDYILKPFKNSEVLEALLKYNRLKVGLKQAIPEPIQLKYPEHFTYQHSFLAQHKESTRICTVSEIAAFHKEFDVVHLHTTKGERLPVYKNLEYIESVCNPDLFFRINRQMLIHRDAISSFSPYFNRKIILELKVTLTEKPVVSRLKVSMFKDWLEGR